MSERRKAAEILTPDIRGTHVFLPDHCANCLEVLPNEIEGLFCSDWCSEVCKNVRYIRGAISSDRIADPQVQMAIRTRLAFLPSGGYKALGRIISPKLRAQIIERDRGLCAKCGQVGDQIDHISGSSSDRANLQLLCANCHNTKTQRSMVPASQATQSLLDALLDSRVFCDTPRLLADDETAWNGRWRELKKQRRQRLLDELAELGLDTTGVTNRSDLVLLRDDAEADSYGYDEDEEIDPESASSYDGGFGTNSYFARAMQRDD